MYRGSVPIAALINRPRKWSPPLPVTLFLLFAGVMASVAIIRGHFDPDYFWHLATGRRILETGSIPSVDPFSFTWAGDPWIPDQWLGEVLIAGLAPIAGGAVMLAAFGIVAAVGPAAHRRIGATARSIRPAQLGSAGAGRCGDRSPDHRTPPGVVVRIRRRGTSHPDDREICSPASTLDPAGSVRHLGERARLLHRGPGSGRLLPALYACRANSSQCAYWSGRARSVPLGARDDPYTARPGRPDVCRRLPRCDGFRHIGHRGMAVPELPLRPVHPVLRLRGRHASRRHSPRTWLDPGPGPRRDSLRVSLRCGRSASASCWRCPPSCCPASLPGQSPRMRMPAGVVGWSSPHPPPWPLSL